MPSPVLDLPQPYLLFLGDTREARYAKTAFGLADWAPERCVGEWSMSAGGGVTTGLPVLTPAEAAARGAKALIIGTAPVGGAITAAWVPSLVEALEAGLDLISGMHSRLADTSELKATAARLGRRLIDVRTPPAGIPAGSGRKRTGKRLLTVGTDCALGKKYTALAIARAFRTRGIDADFRATGQTGIMIAGAGMPLDAVVADFISGAAESLSPDAGPDHWDVVEGQGAILHPAYSGVALGLLHGSQPDIIVACHEVGRTHMLGFPSFPVQTVEETIEANLLLARRTNPAVRCAGLSLNTSSLSETEAAATLAAESRRLGMACADPMRGGPAFEALVDACLGS